MTERELIYEIYGLIEENRGGQTSRPHLYWLIGALLNRYMDEYPMQKDITGAVALKLKEAIKEGVGFSARNLRYMRQFAQTMPHPDQWDTETRSRRWTDHLTVTARASEGRKNTGEQLTTLQVDPGAVIPRRRSVRTQRHARASSGEVTPSHLTDTQVFVLVCDVLTHIPQLSLIAARRHEGQRGVLKAAALHLMSSANDISVVLILHDATCAPGEVARIRGDALGNYPWRTVCVVQVNVETGVHVHPPVTDPKVTGLIKRLLIEVRRVFRART